MITLVWAKLFFKLWQEDDWHDVRDENWGVTQRMKVSSDTEQDTDGQRSKSNQSAQGQNQHLNSTRNKTEN